MVENNSNVFKSDKAKENEGASGFGIKRQPNGLPESVETVVITFDKANGNLQIAGKIDDQVLMFGMLERAKFLVYQYSLEHPKAAPEKIVE